MAGHRAMRVLAVASGGGHWTELMRISSAFEGHDVTYVTVDATYRDEVPGARFFVVRDATRWNKVGLLILGLQLAWVLLRRRPDVVISTGAAPGYLAIRLGRLMRARTIWLDSIANVEEMSLAGRLVGRYANLWLTQWAHLARPGGPQFRGSVM